MFAWFAVCALLFAALGCAGGIFLASRFAWPRRLYALLFGTAR
jgi:hypothetical protein